MRPLTLLAVALLSASLAGCGSLLATLETDTIEDEPTERTLARQLEDESIETKTIVNLRAEDERYDDAHIVVVSYNGYVLLAGQVPEAELKFRANEVVRRIAGVRRIYNEFEVASPSSMMTRSADTWITAKVKSWLLGSPDVQGLRVKVVTENGVVYLMGLVTEQEAERITDTASGISGVQRVVKLFEIVAG